jgi:hypothetical protein
VTGDVLEIIMQDDSGYATIRKRSLTTTSPTSPDKLIAVCSMMEWDQKVRHIHILTNVSLRFVFVSWWEARLNGRSGSIPANYVQLL